MNVRLISGSDKTFTLGLKKVPSFDPVDLTLLTSLVICFSQAGADEYEKKLIKLTGAVTTGSAIVTGLDIDNLMAGDPISGTDIPAETTILSIDTGTGDVTMSANATGTNPTESIVVGDVTISGNPILGKVSISIPAADSANLAEGSYSIEVSTVIDSVSDVAQLKDTLDVTSKICS